MIDNATDLTGTEQPASAAMPAGGGAQPEVQGDDLVDLLSEYDRATAAKPDNGADAAPDDPPQVDAAKSIEDINKNAAKQYEREQLADKASRATQEHIAALTNAVQSLHAGQLREQDRRDFDNVLKIAADTIPELSNAPQDFARIWLLNELHTDARLRDAVARRYESKAAEATANHRMEKALQKLATHAQSIPDRELTGDVAAVSAAVRSGSGKPPAPKAPNYSKMSDAEFQAERDRLYGN